MKRYSYTDTDGRTAPVWIRPQRERRSYYAYRCASCKSIADRFVSGSADSLGTATCRRHLELWIKRETKESRLAQ